MRIFRRFFLVVFFIFCGNASAEEFTACVKNAIAPKANPDVIPPLPAHPRILINAQTISDLKILIANKDPTAVKLLANVTTHNNWILAHFPNPFPIPAAESLSLTTAREIQDIIATNAGLYLLTGNTQYSVRAIAEMLQAAQYPDWDDNNFLVTAEMTQAMAMGYDWLYSVLTAAQIQVIEDGIVKNGLQPGVTQLANGEYNTPNSNWTAVVNGGLLNGVIAMDDASPALVQQIIPYLKANLTAVSSMYAPDGGWVEGPGYFNYATKYFTYAVASLQSGLGTDWNLGSTSGYNLAGDYGVYVNGPTTLSFNYADAANTAYYSAAMIWLSRQFNKPVFGKSEYSVISKPAIASDEIYNSAQMSDFIMELLWYTPCVGSAPVWPATDHLSNGTASSGSSFVFMRSSWSDPDAFSVALKGGNNVGSGHSHADLGSFVLDALGVRWGIQLGAESYSLPNLFPGSGATLEVWNERLYYYMMGTSGQNTLAISGVYQTPPSLENQYGFGTSQIVGYHSNPGTLSFGVVDLTNAYSAATLKKGKHSALVTSAKRGIALIKGNNILVRDEIQATAPVDIVWSFHTFASVSINASKTVATLTDAASGKTLVATLLFPIAGSYFELVSTNPNIVNLPYPWHGTNGCDAAANTWVDTIGCIENADSGINNLVVRVPQASMPTSDVIQVLFNQTGIVTPAVTKVIENLGDLSKWIAKGPVVPPV
jgi:hypothetical protein